MPAVFFGDKVGYEECRPRNGGVFLPPAVVKEIWGRQSGDPDDQRRTLGEAERCRERGKKGIERTG